MKVLIGVGTTELQTLPYLVLRYSLIKNNPELDLEIVRIDQTPEYADFESSKKHGTVFSMQRFFMPAIAANRNADICIYLDSDMLCLKPISPLIDILKNNPNNVVIPVPNRNYKQPQQTAVFGCMVNPYIINKFSSAIDDYANSLIKYEKLINFNFLCKEILDCDFIYNSREIYDENTVILHFTDLFRQPWVSRFNRNKDVWFSMMQQAAIQNESIKLCVMERAGKDYLPSLKSKLVGNRPDVLTVMTDFFFSPPQFLVYLRRIKLIDYILLNRFYFGRVIKFLTGLCVQLTAFLRDILNVRTG